ncbi:hypothetical protein [Kaistella palustris]|uniref:hypothetical protein n=1 Tax=Kaistella palustris TaxID=493376 RepID=UPI00048150D1|nr:hypothetical protein [Kaistella palustris]
MNKSFASLRILPVLGIILILAGYFYLTYQTFKLRDKREALKKENIQLEQIRMSKTAEIKRLDSIAGIQKKIISESTDPKTVEEGKLLEEKIANISTSHFTQNTKGENSRDMAAQFESKGYKYLYNRDVENAVRAFTASENAYNGYHQVYEISRYLKKNEAQLSDKKSDFWSTAYQQILQNFSWKMPQDAKEKLSGLTK